MRGLPILPSAGGVMIPDDLRCRRIPPTVDDHVGLVCRPMTTEERYAHSHPWWWWLCGGAFGTALAWEYLGDRAVQVIAVLAMAGVAAVPVAKLIDRWNARAGTAID